MRTTEAQTGWHSCTDRSAYLLFAAQIQMQDNIPNFCIQTSRVLVILLSGRYKIQPLKTSFSRDQAQIRIYNCCFYLNTSIVHYTCMPSLGTGRACVLALPRLVLLRSLACMTNCWGALTDERNILFYLNVYCFYLESFIHSISLFSLHYYFICNPFTDEQRHRYVYSTTWCLHVFLFVFYQWKAQRAE